jgi:hypothetical protein
MTLNRPWNQPLLLAVLGFALLGAAASAQTPTQENLEGSSAAPSAVETPAPESSDSPFVLQPRNAQTGLTINGNVSATIATPNVRLRADRITSTRASGTSGNLRLSLWATTTVPVFGDTLTGFNLGTAQLTTLAAGQEILNVDRTVAFTAPPAGCYYLTMVLEEQTGGSYVYVDLRTFTAGGTPDGSGHDRFSFGGVSCDAGPSTCVQNATTACLLNGRFQATVRFRNVFDNQPANTNALRKPVTGFANPNFETAFFYFNSVDNIEILLKMLDQGNTNGSGQPTIAVLFGSATPLRVELTITDTQTGAVKTYLSPFNSQRGGTDFTAFVK